ncbi:MAG: GGDEF domain-containing protein [Zetaproteobacteria bacterium CG12_big_fil_rev_8_21_14_0_65_55_1124]|nr:MAG: hypothetical protein AUJ58_04055 [Zetaproteobacteria bacterium CG1_02_55_237]PIS20371.1 MAG: GGDEF domain-containing protein [Zetaproteobacteria bacterium CG08_land_8_20_14_0_20_55_17]PIW42404.1 MAG: GGDEF domain-containing protein [Zetaproteobacteria bacterium CG12_big_fil_rev_8_21_14_0_65_55_1124]PIY52373.1 MAG: GGDEF domain-containing protein [Zetaproteobacteria bacterium CG_4_10_14_0_8_um_filter_55_43]PIZ37152.1 MAG: GGDEF domain-containing protein [Zetaproteobacteria bacterium CG_4
MIVPPDQLQDKSGRYYFKDTFRLKEGEIFISPFDLNMEHGMIERPFKPVIRFGMPIFNSGGEKRGIIVLTYLGGKVLEQLDKFKHNEIPMYDMLLNRDGYFLRAIRSDDEWGFMLPERKGNTFANLFPAIWGKIADTPSGQFMDAQGLFTFSMIFPLAEWQKNSSGAPEASGSSVKYIGESEYRWKIVCFTPREAILGMTHELRTVLLIFNAMFALLAGIGICLLARAKVRHRIAEDIIENMAHYDLLTGLPNRPLLYDRLGMALANAKRNKQIISIFFLDLDGFKDVNDSLGHEAGDHVLKEVSSRLQQCLRGSDTVARLGGDEFVLVMTSTTDSEAAGTIATKVINVLSEPIMLNDHSCSVGASIGIAMYPQDGTAAEDLLSKADDAMYAAKESGKNTYRFSS